MFNTCPQIPNFLVGGRDYDLDANDVKVVGDCRIARHAERCLRSMSPNFATHTKIGARWATPGWQAISSSNARKSGQVLGQVARVAL